MGDAGPTLLETGDQAGAAPAIEVSAGDDKMRHAIRIRRRRSFTAIGLRAITREKPGYGPQEASYF